MVTKSAIKANYGETFAESLEAGGFIFFPEDSSSGRNLGTITKQRWPNRVNGVTTIAYIFQDGLDETRKVAARAAHVILEKSGVVNFVERTFENEVFFIGNYDSESCYVRLGYNPGYPGVINLGWCNDLQFVASIVHEHLHMLGFLHEQSRPDRNDFIQFTTYQFRMMLSTIGGRRQLLALTH